MMKGSEMKKAVFLSVLISLMIMLTGCIGYHKISVRKGDEDYVVKYPRSAKAGEKVTIETVAVTDADLYVNINGVSDIKMTSWAIYEFTMPDHDIEINISIISNGLA